MNSYRAAIHKIKEQIEFKERALITGSNVKEYAQYRQLVGEIAGLNSAVREIEELESAYMENDDD